MATQQPDKKDLSHLHKGASREDIILELGEPIESKNGSSGLVDVYKFIQGYSSGVKTSRAVLHGVADIFTLGLWEAVGTPTEMIADGSEIILKVHYDQNQKVKKIDVLSGDVELNTQKEEKQEEDTTSSKEYITQADLLPPNKINSNAQRSQLDKQYRRISSEYTFKEAKHKNYDSFALIIGIRKYDLNPDVNYADLSALAFKELAIKTLGIPRENIITLLNGEATSGQLKAKFAIIKELADSHGNIYIYYAGHGVPGKDGSSYILPSDMSADAISLEPNLKLTNIYAALAKLDAKNVFIFMDSCFSGKDDNGHLLYKGVAPVLRSKKNVIPKNKLVVFTAGKSTDFANDFGDKQQRLFSYYLIKELSQGEKNLNKIYPKIKNEVKRASLIKGIGYKQVPQIYGNSRKSLYQ